MHDGFDIDITPNREHEVSGFLADAGVFHLDGPGQHAPVFQVLKPGLAGFHLPAPAFGHESQSSSEIGPERSRQAHRSLPSKLSACRHGTNGPFGTDVGSDDEASKAGWPCKEALWGRSGGA